MDAPKSIESAHNWEIMCCSSDANLLHNFSLLANILQHFPCVFFGNNFVINLLQGVW